MPGPGSLWVVEWRDPETKKTGVMVLDTEAGEATVSTGSEASDWWTSLTAVGEQHFYVHSYRNADIPEPSDLLAYELATGELKWALPGCRYAGYLEAGQLVIACKEANGLVNRLCEEATGRILTGPVDQQRFRAETWREAERYTPGETYYDLLKQFLEKEAGLLPVGAIEYLDYADRMVFSFYLYENDSLSQYVGVFNRWSEAEYLEVVGHNLEKQGKGGMLLKGSDVYFVKNKTIFVGINLAV